MHFSAFRWITYHLDKDKCLRMHSSECVYYYALLSITDGKYI